MKIGFDKPVLCSGLIGRADYLKVIERAFDQAGSSPGQVILLAGEAGLGKTRLVSEARREAFERGWQILRGNCFETDASFPYAPLMDLLGSNPANQPSSRLKTGPAMPGLLNLAQASGPGWTGPTAGSSTEPEQ